MTVRRYDFGRVRNVQRTPQGGVLVPASLTRTGILVYRRSDGTERRELRLPDEVFHKDSLDTLARAPVTDGHPKQGFVTANNWKQLTVGHVGESVRQDGKFVAATLAVQDATTVKKVDDGELVELSCGYDCDLEHKGGEFEGERYDAIQRNIRYNHVALGPNNWGRAGAEVSLRLDSNDAVCFDLSEDESRNDNQQPTRTEPMSKVIIDGIEYESGSVQHIQLLNRKLDEQTARADKAEGEKDAAVKRADAADGKVDQLEKEVDELKEPKHLDSLVKERTALIERARKLDSESDFEGLSARDIKVTALKRYDSEFDDTDRSEDYIDGVFGVAVRNAKSDEQRNDSREGSGVRKLREGVRSVQHRDAPERKSRRNDERGDEVEHLDARDRMVHRGQTAWQKPLRMSRRNAD